MKDHKKWIALFLAAVMIITGGAVRTHMKRFRALEPDTAQSGGEGAEVGEHQHSFTETSRTEPTCTADGVITMTCSECGAVEITTIAATGQHNYAESGRKEPTCVEDGQIDYTCTMCGATYSETIAATGEHTFEETGRVEASCETDGVITYTCSVCGEVKEEVIPAIGAHSFEETARIEPGCESDGSVTYTCTVCGTTKEEVLPSLGGHSFAETSRTEATCEADGSITYTCANCGETKTEVIPSPGGHSFAETSRTEAGCETDGSITYTCQACGETKTEVIPSLGGHSFAETSRTEATCEADGSITYTCANCGETKTEVIPSPGGHNFEESARTEATCEADGSITYTCSACGETKSEVIPATGHAWEMTSTGASTEEFNTYRCGNCGEEYSEANPAYVAPAAEDAAEDADKAQGEAGTAAGEAADGTDEAQAEAGAAAAETAVTDSAAQSAEGESGTASDGGSEITSEGEAESESGMESEIESGIESEMESGIESEMESESESESEEESETETEEEKIAVTLTAEYVDEFGDPISGQGSELPAFAADDTLDLTAAAGTVEDFTVDQGSMKLIAYTYEKATLTDGGKEVTVSALKREAIDSEGDGEGYAVSYTADGTTWTELTEDVTVTLHMNGGRRTQYIYEDGTVRVTATLLHANAIPDEAELVVTAILPGTANYDAYLAALNGTADSDEDSFSEENTLLYDISFMYDETQPDGSVRRIEVEPANGMVSINMEFLDSQLTEDIGAETSEDVSVYHLPVQDEVVSSAGSTVDASVSAGDVSVEKVGAGVNVEGGQSVSLTVGG